MIEISLPYLLILLTYIPYLSLLVLKGDSSLKVGKAGSAVEKFFYFYFIVI